MKIRIKKYPKGWVVEIQKKTGFLFKKNSWTHFISVAGIESMPWHFHSYQSALDELLHKIKWDTIKNSPPPKFISDSTTPTWKDHNGNVLANLKQE